jgi:hypothetical protein
LVGRVRETLNILAGCMAQWNYCESATSRPVFVFQAAGYGTSHLMTNLLDFARNDDVHALTSPESLATILAQMETDNFLMGYKAPTAVQITEARRPGDGPIIAALRATFACLNTPWIDGLASNTFVLHVSIEDMGHHELPVAKAIDASIRKAFQGLLSTVEGKCLPTTAVDFISAFLRYRQQPLVLILRGVHRLSLNMTRWIPAEYMHDLMATPGLFIIIPEKCPEFWDPQQASPMAVLTRPLTDQDVSAILHLTQVRPGQTVAQKLGLEETASEVEFVRALVLRSGGNGRFIRAFLDDCLHRRIREMHALKAALDSFGRLLQDPISPGRLSVAQEHLITAFQHDLCERERAIIAAAIVFLIASGRRCTFDTNVHFYAGLCAKIGDVARAFGCALVRGERSSSGLLVIGTWRLEGLVQMAAYEPARWSQLGRLVAAQSNTEFSYRPEQLALAEHMLRLGTERMRPKWRDAAPHLAPTCVAGDDCGAVSLVLSGLTSDEDIRCMSVDVIAVSVPQQSNMHDIVLRSTSGYIAFTALCNPCPSDPWCHVWADVQHEINRRPATLPVPYVLVVLMKDFHFSSGQVMLTCGRWTVTWEGMVRREDSEACDLTIPSGMEVVLSSMQNSVRMYPRFKELYAPADPGWEKSRRYV